MADYYCIKEYFDKESPPKYLGTVACKVLKKNLWRSLNAQFHLGMTKQTLEEFYHKGDDVYEIPRGGGVYILIEPIKPKVKERFHIKEELEIQKRLLAELKQMDASDHEVGIVIGWIEALRWVLNVKRR